MTKRIVTVVAVFAIVLGVVLTEYRPAKAQTCMTNCYYAYQIYLKNKNGTPFTGYVDIHSGGGQPAQYNKHFTNGVMDSGYVWSGFVANWVGSGIALNVYTPGGGTWLTQGIMSLRYTTVPTIPNVAVATFW